MTKSPITKTGAERLREQLHELKTVENDIINIHGALGEWIDAVSYTHLTLPTIYSV